MFSQNILIFLKLSQLDIVYFAPILIDQSIILFDVWSHTTEKTYFILYFIRVLRMVLLMDYSQMDGSKRYLGLTGFSLNWFLNINCESEMAKLVFDSSSICQFWLSAIFSWFKISWNSGLSRIDDSGSFRLSIDHCIGSEIKMSALKIGLGRLCVGSRRVYKSFIKFFNILTSKVRSFIILSRWNWW